ncbi:MAG: glycosyltransferase family 39 protein [Flavobacteriaceae bacterium]|nr:glycosyltransferase family 39 protein [Flavobacteriaceae bacterium]
MKTIKNNYTFWIIATCIAIFFVNLDALLINIMEARNFITAREMIQDGNWILTTLNGEPRYQKPPLPTWLTAFSAMTFGLKSLFALRLPAALVTVLLVVFFNKLAILFSENKKYAFISSLILLTSFYIVFAGRNGQWDIFTHGFMMVTIYQLYLFFTSEEKKYQRALIAAIFFGMSFMSKGPVSLYALFLPFLISFGIVYKFKDFKARIIPLLLFLIVGLVLSGWWHWYTFNLDPEAVTAITKKETSNWTSYEIKPFYYYWSFFTQSGVWTIPAFIGLLFPYLKNRVFYKKAYLFTFLWTMISLVLLSIIPEKKSRYLLPVLIPLALNTGFYIEYLIRSFKEIKDKREVIPVYFNFGLIALIGIAFPIAAYLFLRNSLNENWIWFSLLSISLFSIGLLILRFLKQKNIEKVFYLTIAFIVSIIFFGMPMANSLTVNPEYNSLENLNSWQEETNNKVYNYSGFCPEMIWAYGKPIKSLVKNKQLTFPKESSFGILLEESQEKKFQNKFKDYSIEKITRYDMNPSSPGSKSHRPRLWRDLYLVNKLKSKD